MNGEHPEWLPEDWKVCVRVRSSGKKDKYYVNPSNATKFNSKPEVLRYLKSVMKDLKGRNKVDTKKTAIEETHITRKGGAKMRREPYLIESLSGRREVKRYLETKTDASGGKRKDKDSIPEDEAAVGKKRKKNSRWMNGLPRRASKRIARVEADPLLEVNTTSGAREATRLPQDAEVNPSETNLGKTEVNTSENLDKQKETTTEEQECASVELEEEKQPNSSLSDLFTDPCIEFAIKTLTGAIPLEEVIKLHLASPIQAPSPSSVDIWADPCFEFAVKTLTGGG